MTRLRTGITTGACAAAAAKAAAMVLAGQAAPAEVELTLPGGQTLSVPILYARAAAGRVAEAAVEKDAGDDPDVTHGLHVVATVGWAEGDGIAFAAGEGVGTVTKPGLQVPPGNPAINPMPRKMIAAAVRSVTGRGVRVEISIPGGREIAAKTFNPRLGIEGGLSVLGTTGIVRPYCMKAMHDALRCALDVARACGVTRPVLVPGNIGAKAATRHLKLRDEQIIEVGNEWGFVLELFKTYSFEAVLVVGHPGKLAKLAAGQWDTHSSRSSSALDEVNRLCLEILKTPPPPSPTVEGLFGALDAEPRRQLADALAGRIGSAVVAKIGGGLTAAVMLVNMAGEELGRHGEVEACKGSSMDVDT